MLLICSSSSDDDVLVRQSLAAVDPLELLPQHPCCRDSGGWQRGVGGIQCWQQQQQEEDVDNKPSLGSATLRGG